MDLCVFRTELRRGQRRHRIDHATPAPETKRS
eukprot:COSAG06_NODE_25566_length_633_cov_23.498127_1_plen_31_part_10